MRFPLVSRSAHDELRTALETQILRLQRELEKEQQRSEQLMDTVLSLKVSGATSILRASPAGAAVPKVAQPTRSAFQQAIDEHPRASGNIMLRNHLSRWAEKRLKQKPEDVDEDEWIETICDELRGWSAVSGNDGDDEDDEDDE